MIPFFFFPEIRYTISENYDARKGPEVDYLF